jgi:hypothetical protein
VAGPHYLPPPYVIAVSRTDAAGATDHVTFSLGFTLFGVTDDYRTFEVAEDDVERLTHLLFSVHDPAMAPVDDEGYERFNTPEKVIEREKAMHNAGPEGGSPAAE